MSIFEAQPPRVCKAGLINNLYGSICIQYILVFAVSTYPVFCDYSDILKTFPLFLCSHLESCVCVASDQFSGEFVEEEVSSN